MKLTSMDVIAMSASILVHMTMVLFNRPMYLVAVIRLQKSIQLLTPLLAHQVYQ